MENKEVGNKDAGKFNKVLYQNTAGTSSIKFTQDTIGGVIWIETTGKYPICTNELGDVLTAYVSKED